MIKKLTGLTASVAALVSTASAEVKIDDYLSLDGYATGSYVVTEGTAPKDAAFVESPRVYDSVLVALNGKYEDFTARVSLLALDSSVPANAVTQDAGLLDAYITYKTGNFAITGGKYLGWLGFESFHSVNNAFISFSQATYATPYATGVKLEYLGETLSGGISVRDSQISATGTFFEGDGEISGDVGYEAYVLYTGIEKLTLFAGVGYEDVEGFDSVYTWDVWASYAITDKLSLAAELSTTEEATQYSWLIQPTYAVTDKLSVAGRLTGSDGDNGASDAIGYGAASTYTLTKNFAVKGEITKTDFSAAPDVFSYAIQGIFKF